MLCHRKYLANTVLSVRLIRRPKDSKVPSLTQLMPMTWHIVGRWNVRRLVEPLCAPRKPGRCVFV